MAGVGRHFVKAGLFLCDGDAVPLHHGPELLGEPGAELRPPCKMQPDAGVGVLSAQPGPPMP